jgi:probable rRNA maturation factor
MPDDHRCLIDLRWEVVDAPPIDRERLATAVDHALAGDERSDCALTVLVIGDERCSALHYAHFGDAETTDVMTFPDGSTDPESGREHLGDIAICADVARRAAAARAADGGDVEALASEECILYIVHGLLHLLGFDDIDPEDRAELWQRQREVLAAVGIEIGESES